VNQLHGVDIAYALEAKKNTCSKELKVKYRKKNQKKSKSTSDGRASALLHF
jgi:hypothetical protein